MMLSSSFAGFVWYKYGSAATFILSASVAFVIVFYMLFFVKEKTAEVTNHSA
jgi:hypothetical protein